MTDRDRRLEAPHRRVAAGSRLVELVAVRAYRVTSGLIGRIPPGVARAIIARAAQLSYLMWPTKRRWSSSNFGHVLGLPRGDRRVHLMALAAYSEYARYIVELMRLPRMTRAEAARMVDQASIDPFESVWRGSNGLIFALGHVGNNEAVAAAIAERGWPISVVADDTAYPELYEDFRRVRESWGVHLIPWRNLREIFGVLRRREMLALLVDWGYRSDGIPVRLFDAWTTLPAGPATLAARTGALLVPVTIRRDAADRFHVSWATPIRVPSTSPADLARATQKLADALEATIAAAPQQWYSFKPIWPDAVDEARNLELRAASMLAHPGQGEATATAEQSGDAAATAVRRGSAAGHSGEVPPALAGSG